MAVVDSIIDSLVCPVCKQEKPLTLEFWKERQSSWSDKRYWIKARCKSCYNDGRREHARLHAREVRSTKEGRARLNENSKRWKDDHREIIRERHRAENRRYNEKLAEQAGRVYISAHERKRLRAERIASGELIDRDMEALVRREARQAWQWWIKEGAPDWWVKVYWDNHDSPWLNPRLSKAESWKVKYRFNHEFQISERMRRQVRKAKTHDGIADIMRESLNRGSESRKVENELGYTVAELKSHIERQFTKRMSWDKFKQGLIHIDHIVPKSQFDLSDPDEWKACWALSNLRPLWATDNLRKSDSVIFLL